VNLVAEFVGVCLVAYGIWYSYKGVMRLAGSEKDWWRPLSRRQRYPYPAAGILLGICFAVLGLRFALHNVWAQARTLGYVGIGVFALVLVAGVVQPRFLHPRWYGRLQDSLGKERVLLLQREAHKASNDEWVEIAASESAFDQWVKRTAPSSTPSRRRTYTRNTDRESDN
jgi:hypothetical protein